ncbi:MAG: pirin family protein [Gammaproteobacteria bacterium]
MIYIRPANQRGLTKISWLESFHTFSFDQYYDPDYMSFGNLRVINEDTIFGGGGFDAHPHRNMEILTYIISGKLKHQDSMGNGSVISPGEIQRMTAGSGVRHSEFNDSKTDPVHLLQIWILPNQHDLTPSYEQKSFDQTQKNQLILIASPEKNDDAVTIHQDVNLYVAYLELKNTIQYSFSENRNGWLQLIKGNVKVNNEIISAGDGVAIDNKSQLTVHALTDAEFLLFDFKVE